MFLSPYFISTKVVHMTPPCPQWLFYLHGGHEQKKRASHTGTSHARRPRSFRGQLQGVQSTTNTQQFFFNFRRFLLLKAGT